MSEDNGNIHTRLGKLEATVQHFNGRFDRIEEKLDRTINVCGDIEHMKNNIKMMKGPVEDYEKVKQRGIGMWMLGAFVFSLMTALSTVLGYVIRAFVLQIGSP